MLSPVVGNGELKQGEEWTISEHREVRQIKCIRVKMVAYSPLKLRLRETAKKNFDCFFSRIS